MKKYRIVITDTLDLYCRVKLYKKYWVGWICIYNDYWNSPECIVSKYKNLFGSNNIEVLDKRINPIIKQT